MFDLPNAKRVRREDILSRASSTSRSPSPQPESANPDAQQRLAELLNLDTFIADQPEPTGQDTHPNQEGVLSKGEGEAGEEEEQEFEFRLFSAPAAPKTQAQAETTNGAADGNDDKAPGAQKLRIRLRSPTPETGEGRFVNPFRGWGYYFSTPTLSGLKVDEDPQLDARKKQFADVAVSGDDMLAWARVSWPGCHLPWRVIRLNRQHTKLPKESNDANIIAYNAESDTKTPKSHKKPGKKRRLQLRKRVKAAEQAKESEAEKRNRKNRERKIKRRQKAREIKAATAAATGQPLPVEMDEDVSSQEEDN
ncbi:DUF2011 domain-containing protein [Aspergillus affinis]|uniref:DUF2011 domain-containing protein n=1 Tax=Aspergillus affinis TaxID=1070780 RepID=UPI0022FEDAA1|nr:uncharacterized protein KD926_004067 [Aspergillus affinis]KAI9046229.1 hypothetical protein KD926_004067 [Aspergillus affinis]